METTLLSGPSQFTLEAWNYMWRHRWFLLSIAVLPWILETGSNYLLGMTSLNADLFVSPINKIFQPFWAMAWLGYLLKPATPNTIRSYFKYNINYVWYALYAVALSAPFIGMDYLLKSYNVHMGVITLVDLLWTMAIIPFLMLFPGLALNRHIFIKDSLQLSRPFRKDFVQSGLIGLFMTMLTGIFLFFLFIPPLLSMIQFNPHPILRMATANLFGIWVDALLLTITGIYYKRYLTE